MRDPETPAVFHLIWTPLDEKPFQQFLQSYTAYHSGIAHRLVVIVNGGWRPWIDACLQATQVNVELTVLDEPVLDLEAYRVTLTSRARAPAYCFLNSYAAVRSDAWLAKLLRPLRKSSVGIAGAGGSYETMRAHVARVDSSLGGLPIPNRVAARASLVRGALRAYRAYPSFPNPHVRTSAFAIRGDLLDWIAWPSITTKDEAWRLESGRRGLSAQVKRRGLRLVVVGRDGQAFDEPEWPTSYTARSGTQDNLLVADNRTREYGAADATRRRELARLAWGNRA